MPSDSTPSDPSEKLAVLQDRLYDLVVTRITQPQSPDAIRRLRRDAHEAAALAGELADVILRIDDDPHPA